MDVSRETSRWREWPEEKILSRGASEIGLDLEPGQTARLIELLTEIRGWNEKINLIGPGLPAEQIVLHLIDSAAPLPLLPAGPLKVLDLGSGAGLPGLVLKTLRPKWEMTLTESREKKAVFLRRTVRTLDLRQVRVYSRAGPENSKLPLSAFDLITARALGPLTHILDLAQPYMARGGRILAYKGPRAGQELEVVANRIDEMGLELTLDRKFKLPFLDHERRLLIFKIKPPQKP